MNINPEWRRMTKEDWKEAFEKANKIFHEKWNAAWESKHPPQEPPPDTLEASDKSE